MSDSMRADVRRLPGIGEKKAGCLGRLGITGVEELLRHFPRAYQNRGDIRLLSEVRDGDICTVRVTASADPTTTPTLKNHTVLTRLRVFDASGTATVLFFNQPYMKNVFHCGDVLRIWGKIRRAGRGVEIVSPSVEPIVPGKVLPALTPVYPLTSGIGQKDLYNAVGTALLWARTDPPEPVLPEEVRLAHGFPTLYQAYEGIHRPADMAEMERARAYFVYEELYLFSLGLTLNGQRRRAGTPPPMVRPHFGEFLSALPFALTGAQKRCIVEIGRDLCAPAGCPPMARLVSGDVGSGKTAVAAAAIWLCLKNGYQAALMAPTSLLAAQHYEELSALFGKLGFAAALLTGSTPAAEKRRIKAGLADGSLPFVIGTHALLTGDVRFARRGLVVTDEQHRFGVGQRSALAARGEGEAYDPHVLVMSATPIPRTLSLILHGDLDVSVLDELPPGRQKVDTYVVSEDYRARLNGFIRKQVEEGGQVYIVCPAIEPENGDDPDEGGELIPFFGTDEPSLPLHAAAEYAQLLQDEVFPDLSVGLLHGKMKPKEKDEVMARFAAGQIRILVSTTVIEVGMNVPNASLMVVENAERFGLSQLHQLRGRVGRGRRKSCCVLVSDAKGDAAKARLGVMKRTSSGFEIAEEDLKLRGPGDFFPTGDGQTRQSGAFSLGLASLCTDMTLLTQASEDAKRTLTADPALSREENRRAREEMQRLFSLGADGRS